HRLLRRAAPRGSRAGEAARRVRSPLQRKRRGADGGAACSEVAECRLPQLRKDPVEIIDCREIYRDLAFSCSQRDLDPSVEPVPEPLSDFVEVTATTRLRLGQTPARGIRTLRRRLGRADRQILVDDLV